jgi:16S rRNA (guanine966-N2)-methyltransferase
MGQIRLIGGMWRGRRISFPDAPGLRPTPDRVRETLFNWLGQRLTGWVCLDLFAGTGALGFEAASRGAERVVFIERQRRLVDHLHRWAEALDPTRLVIVGGDALQCALSWHEPVDLLFLDPPYHRGLLEQISPLLDQLVRPDGAVYAEAERPIERLGQWQTIKAGRAGQVHFHLLRRLPDKDADGDHP